MSVPPPPHAPGNETANPANAYGGIMPKEADPVIFPQSIELLSQKTSKNVTCSIIGIAVSTVFTIVIAAIALISRAKTPVAFLPKPE